MATAKRAAPSGRRMSPSLFSAAYFLSGMSATEFGSGVASRASTGASTCTPVSARRRRALRPSASLSAGTSRMRIVSEVAMSLNGMPTTSFAPSFLYIVSGRFRSSRVTADMTVPSRWRRPRKSTSSVSLCSGSTPLRRSNRAKLRFVSSNSGTPIFCSMALVPRSARRLQGSISSSGSSVRETRMVSPSPSRRRLPMPIADFMRPSSPSPASVTPRCIG
mmetsp:Transcript_4919/g.11926  ORF Transcript_4919/g.11926 Transcript_4919/m.11926 type:complete len:220 (+) Transcript_4919:913-1572(+)